LRAFVVLENLFGYFKFWEYEKLGEINLKFEWLYYFFLELLKIKDYLLELVLVMNRVNAWTKGVLLFSFIYSQFLFWNTAFSLNI